VRNIAVRDESALIVLWSVAMGRNSAHIAGAGRREAICLARQTGSRDRTIGGSQDRAETGRSCTGLGNTTKHIAHATERRTEPHSGLERHIGVVVIACCGRNTQEPAAVPFVMIPLFSDR
jgi:hypothetical protein